MARLAWLSLSMATIAACSPPGDPVCGEGSDPVIVTGLNGLLDGVAPTVEVQLRVPEDCGVLDTRWMFWDEESESVVLGEDPGDGHDLARQGVEVGDDVIYFPNENLGVRLDYPDGVVGPELALVWFTAGVDLVTVDCSATGELLECAVRGP